MSLPNWVLAYKEPKTEIRFIKGGYYKYAVEYKYNSEKGRTDKITKGLLGKLIEDKGFIPSEKNSLKEKSYQIPRVDIKIYGLFKLFCELLAEDLNSLLLLFDVDIVHSLLSIAMMRFAYQCPLKRIPYLHAHDYCSEEWAKNGLGDKKITATLRFIGENRSKLVAWMKSRIGMPASVADNFVMIDSTHIHSLSENIHVNSKGYNPQHNYDPQIRLMYIMSAQLKQPVYYRLVNGNITDVTSMKKCVEEFGTPNVVFVADKGFYSKQNTTDLQTNKLYYIIPLYRNNKLIDLSPLQKANFKKETKNYFVYQDRVIWYYEYENEDQKIITFLDEGLRVEEETDYLLRTKTHPDECNETEFYEKINQFGTLSLVSHLSEQKTPQEIYIAYKQRNEIEIMFDAFKNFLKADKTYMQDRYVLEGWLMANFIAMIAYYRLFIALKENELICKYSPADIVEMSTNIYKFKIGETWTLSETNKKTIQLFNKLKIDYLN